MNQLLRKIIEKKLAIVTNLTRDEPAARANLIAEASCFQLELGLNGAGTAFAGKQPEDETDFFKVSYCRVSPYRNFKNRPLMCRGCRKDFRLIKNRSNTGLHVPLYQAM